MSPFSSKKSFDSSKCVSLLEVTQKRIDILRKKRSIIAKQSREDVATLLGRGQDANAAARADHVYREENITGAYELLEQHCQLVIKGISAIKSEKRECSPELKEAIASVIYAAPRCGELQELQRVRDLFATRYGSDYVTAILELQPGCAVNAEIIQKLSSRPPNSDVRLNLLKGIALEYKIEWNYQRAVAASFKNGEASEKAKVSPSASKRGLTDDAPSPNSVDSKPKEPAASSAAQSAIPLKARVDKSEFEKSNQSSDVSRDPARKDGDKGQASSARQNSAPSMIHAIRPRERDGISPNKSSSIGSLTVDESVHHDRSKGNASLPSRNSAPPTMHRAEPKKEDFANTKEEPAAVGKQRRSSFLMHQDDEWKGYPSSEAKGNASLLTHNSAPPTVHKAEPREEDFAKTKEEPAAVGKQRGNSFLMHQNDDRKGHPSSEVKGNASLPSHDMLKGNASLLTHNSAPPTVHKAEPRKEDFTNTKGKPAAVGKQRQSSFLMHQNDERKGHPSLEAHEAHSSPATRANYEDRFARPDEHTSLNVEYSTERALHPSREFSSKAKVAPTPSSADARVPEAPGVLGRPMQQAASTPVYKEAKVFLSKPEPLSNGESLAAKQYLRAHESYVKVDTAKMHEDLRGEGVSRIKFQSKQGASNPVANPPPYNTADAHVESMAVHKKVHQQAQEQKSSHKAMNREDVSIIDNKDRAEGHMRGAHQEMHERERSRGREGSFLQTRHQLEENLLEQKGRSTPRPPVRSELRSMKEGVDQELADLEIAIASAARAADAAINMVRTCSMRSRADKQDVQKRERNSQTRKSYGGLYSETGSDARRAFHNTSIAKGDLDLKQPYQEQEPVSLDSDGPQFDDYSSDDSEKPPLYSTGRLPLRNQHDHVDSGKPSNMSAKPSATAFAARVQHDLSRERLHTAKRNSQNEMVYDDDCAESVDSYSPKSPSSSHKHYSSSDVYRLQSDVRPFYKSQLDEYEEPDNARVSRVLHYRNNVYARDEKLSSGRHGLGNDRAFDMKLANENADRGVLKWQGTSVMATGDVDKKKWTPGNAQPPSQPYKQRDAMATRSGEGKFQGVSRRSVLSLGPT